MLVLVLVLGVAVHCSTSMVVLVELLNLYTNKFSTDTNKFSTAVRHILGYRYLSREVRSHLVLQLHIYVLNLVL